MSGLAKGAKAVGLAGQIRGQAWETQVPEKKESQIHTSTTWLQGLEALPSPCPAQAMLSPHSDFCRSRSPKSKRKEKNKERKR